MADEKTERTNQGDWVFFWRLKKNTNNSSIVTRPPLSVMCSKPSGNKRFQRAKPQASLASRAVVSTSY